MVNTKSYFSSLFQKSTHNHRVEYPHFKSIGKSFGFLQLYFLTVVIFNIILGANYVYLMGKPPTASPMDLFGPWPWYILALELIALVLFYLIWKLYQVIGRLDS